MYIIYISVKREKHHAFESGCNMGETKNISYYFWKIHCSMGGMMFFTKNTRKPTYFEYL